MYLNSEIRRVGYSTNSILIFAMFCILQIDCTYERYMLLVIAVVLCQCFYHFLLVGIIKIYYFVYILVF